jgi:hypothetical protein
MAAPRQVWKLVLPCLSTTTTGFHFLLDLRISHGGCGISAQRFIKNKKIDVSSLLHVLQNIIGAYTWYEYNDWT